MHLPALLIASFAIAPSGILFEDAFYTRVHGSSEMKIAALTQLEVQNSETCVFRQEDLFTGKDEIMLSSTTVVFVRTDGGRYLRLKNFKHDPFWKLAFFQVAELDENCQQIWAMNQTASMHAPYDLDLIQNPDQSAATSWELYFIDKPPEGEKMYREAFWGALIGNNLGWFLLAAPVWLVVSGVQFYYATTLFPDLDADTVYYIIWPLMLLEAVGAYCLFVVPSGALGVAIGRGIAALRGSRPVDKDSGPLSYFTSLDAECANLVGGWLDVFFFEGADEEIKVPEDAAHLQAREVERWLSAKRGGRTMKF
jgi:hypothetical protein